jgi:hypothetical protein
MQKTLFSRQIPRSGEPHQLLAQRTGASSRETLSAVPHAGNPQDQTASPRHCPPLHPYTPTPLHPCIS